jgi:hypothetical protein
MTGSARIVAVVLGIACCAAIAPAQVVRGQAVPPDSAAAVAELHSTCGDNLARSGFGLLRGVVRDADSLPVGSVAVTVAWRRPLEVLAGANPTGGTTDRPALGVLSDSAGRWRLCGAPLRTPLVIRAAADEGSDERSATLDDVHPVGLVDFSLRPRTIASGVVRSVQTSALVLLTVQDRDGNALGGVALDVAPSNGPVRTVITDSAGRAIVPAVDPGRARVTSRAIGYRPGELSVPLDAGRNTVPLTLDAVRIPTLATVRVIGDRQVLARHQEFETRRSLRQATASITAEDIAAHNPVDTWQMLTSIPSMRVLQYGEGVAGVFAMSTREQPLVQRKGAATGGISGPCWYRVMVDGVMLPDAMPDLSVVLPLPSDVHGIEVFAGLATIPSQYVRSLPDGQGNLKSNSCGLIAVWTK